MFSVIFHIHLRLHEGDVHEDHATIRQLHHVVHRGAWQAVALQHQPQPRLGGRICMLLHQHQCFAACRYASGRPRPAAARIAGAVPNMHEHVFKVLQRVAFVEHVAPQQGVSQHHQFLQTEPRGEKEPREYGRGAGDSGRHLHRVQRHAARKERVGEPRRFGALAPIAAYMVPRLVFVRTHGNLQHAFAQTWMLAHIDGRYLNALEQQCRGEGEHARALPLAKALGFLATLSAVACTLAQLIQRYGFVLHGSRVFRPQWGHVERRVCRTAADACVGSWAGAAVPYGRVGDVDVVFMTATIKVLNCNHRRFGGKCG